MFVEIISFLIQLDPGILCLLNVLFDFLFDKFHCSIVGRGSLISLFCEDPYISYPSFFKFCPPPLALFGALFFFWLNVLSCRICVVLIDIMDLNLLSFGALVLAALCCVLCNNASNLRKV